MFPYLIYLSQNALVIISNSLRIMQRRFADIIFHTKLFGGFIFSAASPGFSQAPLDISMDIGSNLTLPCQALGYPNPRIRWRRVDGVSIFSRHSTVSSVTQLRTGSLFFNSK